MILWNELRTLINNKFKKPTQLSLPDWSALINSSNFSIENNNKSQKVLLALCYGGHTASTILEGLLSVALKLRGHECYLLLCDEQLPACTMSVSKVLPVEKFIKEGISSLCKDCYMPAYNHLKSLEKLGIKILKFSDYINQDEVQKSRLIAQTINLDEITHYTHNGLKIGEHAQAGALRYFSRGDLTKNEDNEVILRKYLESAILTAKVTESLITKNGFDVAVFSHGIYVPHGVIGEVCRHLSVRVVNWMQAYRKQTFIFSHGDTYHHTMMTESVKEWEDLDLDKKNIKKINNYLKSRRNGSHDWIWFHKEPEENFENIVKTYNIDKSQKIITLLTNVIWDAQLHYPKNVFNNLVEWVLETISFFINKPHLQLIIRIHPAEVRGALPSQQPMYEEIMAKFPQLPKNIIIIKPDENASTYSLCENSNAVLIYGTKTGVEISTLGIPVIVAGEAWIRNKGITMDASTKEEYFKILSSLPLSHRLDSHTIKRAIKYAYHFFLRRMIPLKFIKSNNGWPPYILDIKSLKELERGANKGLDVICEGIETQSPFIYRSEQKGYF